MKAFDIHQQSQDDLLSLLRRLVYHGENNSALVIGPRGSGKTFLINKIIESFTQELKQKNCSDDLIVVYLSGCLQIDDKSALLEITRQLKLENCINGKVFGSFCDSFEFLLKSFRSGGQTSKPLVFIMDEFDLFTKNKTQLLLYTLLNTIQSSLSPMFMIGATCRIDVLDLLEKRIKSRFSHRQIYLFNDYSFETYMEMAKFFIQSNKRSNGNTNTPEYLNILFEDKNILKFFARQYDYDRSMATLKRLLILPSLIFDQLSQEDIISKNLDMVKKELIKSYNLLNIDTKYSLLSGLSILELTLVVVMLEMSETYPDEPFNFDLVYNAYLKYLQKKNWNQQRHERQIILKAYEHLISLKFVLPSSDATSSNRSTKISKEHSLMYLALDKDEIQLCIDQYPNCPTELKYYSMV
ncbi:origin recognition complex subunit 4 [Brachionus plicatilis]|uniref:Origin recognition complex subunit 4 n=1 Tax=Brachionus plicatilis TaxID=10195 RepID=A0A3M7TAJ4_BRAPC|nr:origin recognition complex subunit 4 [Brachionus plicatilis]